MSDFSELCPLFETGVFKEVTFPYVSLTDIEVGVNALMGTITASHGGAYFTFGRTVVVTGGFVKRVDTSEAIVLNMQHFTSVLADATAFGTLSMTTTAIGVDPRYWAPLPTFTGKTFTSDEVLGFGVATGTAVSAGIYDLIVRYKEK
jgi:hypothetical protein